MRTVIGIFFLGISTSSAMAGSFGFSPYQTSALPRAQAVAIADLLGDSRKEIVVVTDKLTGSPTSEKVFIFTVDPINGPQIVTSMNYSSGPFQPSVRVSVADLDQNGLQDILVGHALGIDVIRNLGQGNFSDPTLYPTTTYAGKIATLDADRDGDLDIVGASTIGVYLLSNNGNGTFSPATTIPLPAGYPVLDVKVTLLDGQMHAVDSSEMAFRNAGSIGTKEAMRKAGPVVLEPIMKVEVRIPEDYFGSVVGDLNSRRGMIASTDAIGNTQVVVAMVPLAETFGYSTDLRSLTQGRASYSMEFDHYEEVPKNIAATLTKQAAGVA